MPLSSPNPTDVCTAVLAGRSIEVRWSARTADELRKFVITLQPVDASHALLDAWVEAEAGARSTVRRQPVRCVYAGDDRVVHVDAYHDDRRVVALTLATDGRDLLYARSPLLARAGFAPGAYDPPTARLLARGVDAASA